MAKNYVKNTQIKRYNPRNSFKTFQIGGVKQNLHWQIIDELYDTTILKRIINRYTAAAIPPFFNVIVEDQEGERIDDLEKLVAPLSAALTRDLFREILKSMLLYGTAIVYKGDKVDGVPNDIFLLHPKDVKPVIGDENNNWGELLGYEYLYQDKLTLIPAEDIMLLANDPPIGEIFGVSILNHMISTLHQLLNNQLDLSEILNRYAVPILKWSIETAEDELADASKVKEVRDRLFEQLNAGDDVVIDDKIKAEVIGFAENQFNLNEIQKETRKMLGMLAIPSGLLGDDLGNLSAGKIYLQTFNSDSTDYQIKLNDSIVKYFYIPFLSDQSKIMGKDYKSVYINFTVISSELNSDKIIWAKTGYELGAISVDELRSNLGFRGKAPGVTEQLKEYYEVKTGKMANEGEANLEPKVRDGREPVEENSLKEMVNQMILQGRITEEEATILLKRG